MASNAPFVIQPYLTSIALAYKNNKMIADDVLPRIPVGGPIFKFSTYTKSDAFTVPNTKVGRKSKPHEIEWSATETTDQVDEFGLEDAIPVFDTMVSNTGQLQTPIDPQARSTELLTDLIALDREQRVANLVFASGTYPAANKTTLSGTSQWSDFTNSNPISAILAALDGMLVRPNIMVIGRAVWTQLSQHPKIVAAAYPLGGNSINGGVVASRQAVANLLELDDIIVGEGWVNSAKKGQTATMVRVWGKHCALLYRNALVSSPTGGVTFGFTAEWGNRFAGTFEDRDIGLRGGTRVRVGEALKEEISASDTGYLFINAVA